MKENKRILIYCKECLMPHTRPRQEFNKEGICAACEWNKQKKTSIDWKKKWSEKLYRRKDLNSLYNLANNINKYNFENLLRATMIKKFKPYLEVKNYRFILK